MRPQLRPRSSGEGWMGELQHPAPGVAFRVGTGVEVEAIGA
jgi:hypothetical protein